MVVALGGVGQQVDDVIHQHQAAKTGDAGAAEHGEQTQFLHALVQAVQHFPIGEVVTFKEPVHEGLVGLGNGFLQSVVELFNYSELVVGNGDLHSLELLHLVGPLIEHIDDASDLLGAVPDGHHNRGNLVAVLFPEGLKGGVVVGVVLVHLGDVDESGHIPLLAVFPGLLKAYGDAVLGGAHQNSGISGPEGLHNSAGEVKSAGGVQHVNLHIFVFQRHHGGGDGDVTLDLLGIVIANGVAVGILADPVNGTGHVKQTFGKGGLTAAAMTQQTDIADGINGIHSSFDSFREGDPSMWARTPE